MLDTFFYYSLLLALSLATYLLRCAGALYIGLEGTFIFSVFSCFYFFYLKLPLLVVFLGIFFSIGLFLALFYILHFSLKINENFVGIFINTFSLALIDLINRLVFDRKGILFFHNPFNNLYVYRYLSVLVLLLLCLVIGYFLMKTSLGLRLRMASTPAIWKRERGLCTYCDSLFLFVASTFLISVASMTLVVSLNAYTLKLGAGMGWLSLFALLLGFNRLTGIVLSCAFLALTLAISYTWQESFGLYVSKSLPYFSSFIAYLLISIWQERLKKRSIYRFS